MILSTDLILNNLDGVIDIDSERVTKITSKMVNKNNIEMQIIRKKKMSTID